MLEAHRITSVGLAINEISKRPKELLPPLRNHLTKHSANPAGDQFNSVHFKTLRESRDLDGFYKSPSTGNCEAFFDFTESQDEKKTESFQSFNLKKKLSSFGLETINEIPSELCSNKTPAKTRNSKKISSENRSKINIRFPNQRAKENQIKVKSLSPKSTDFHLPIIKSMKSVKSISLMT